MTEILLNLDACKEGFGFGLIEDEETKSQRISNIVPQSPAEMSGLQEGDKVLMIDKYDINKLSYKKALSKIKKSKKKLRLKILRREGGGVLERVPEGEGTSEEVVVQQCEEGLERVPEGVPEGVRVPESECLDDGIVKENEEVIVEEREEILEGVPEYSARDCEVRAKEGGTFGFTLVMNEDKHLIANVIANSPAADAGVREGDIVVQVNDVNVEKMEHEEVVELIKGREGSVSLLVVDECAYQYFFDRKLTISSECVEHVTNFG
ncbi:Na(+)/H(+) exchange regulatory cofactor NHE-RF3-like [Octopus sinensis]|uniref:Na(+)/H(+) exchange regulatory cofactor NHE-RF3-like n=1 Tax=Octopus sinensis TaxID=2607531 RepID=A0A6P7TU78_9MOLL|nr:Na(+)/H(+) exchange regulatory cofactor NHE-RF3-like [Octopus sinensis]XP_029655844.1 Na(+)/H(+) exchange regulatory cofactor NHE-RF3-like [Octopus sinensis]